MATLDELLLQETEFGKYPSTPHFSFSPGFGNGDVMVCHDSSSAFCGDEIVVTEKLDGQRSNS